MRVLGIVGLLLFSLSIPQATKDSIVAPTIKTQQYSRSSFSCPNGYESWFLSDGEYTEYDGDDASFQRQIYTVCVTPALVAKLKAQDKRMRDIELKERE